MLNAQPLQDKLEAGKITRLEVRSYVVSGEMRYVASVYRLDSCLLQAKGKTLTDTLGLIVAGIDHELAKERGEVPSAT